MVSDNKMTIQIKVYIMPKKKKKGCAESRDSFSRLLFGALFDAESGRPLNEFSCAPYLPVDCSFVVVDKKSLSACKSVEENPHTISQLCVCFSLPCR